MSNTVSLESELQASVRQLIQSVQDPERSEKRQHVRYPYFRPVTINLDHSIPQFSALTRDISRTGVGLLHKNLLHTDQVFSMTLEHKYGYAVTIPMCCIWCLPCGAHWYFSGACFRDVTTNGDSANVEFTRSDAASQQPGRPDAWDLDSVLSPTAIWHLLNRNFEGLAEWRNFDPNFDRQCEERYYVSLPVTATPVDVDLQSTGESFDVITRDISSLGIALFGRRKLDNKYLSLHVMDLDGQTKLDAVMEALRCQSIGDHYMIAGRFVANRYSD